jgi:hypothetical protein
MLQNRVDPAGNFIRASARGAWMGNRGVIHRNKEIVKPFNHQAWIICALEFKGRKRKVMQPDRWTELFFLDEATAFSAGHRPCFECRREAALRFKSFWIKGNPQYGFTMKTPISQIDAIIHTERIDAEKRKVTYRTMSSDVPDGTFIQLNENPYLLRDQKLHRWSPSGYTETIAIPEGTKLTVLTPKSIVNAFRAGYVPI